MSRHALRIARVRGVDVRLDPSLVLLALLFAWVFAERFATSHPPAVAWTMAAGGVVGLLASILAHELAHALEALHRDIEVEGITLLMFGGITEMHASGESPRDEFVIAAVGPYVSLLCGAVFGLVATFAGDLPGPLGAPVAEVAGVLAWLNVVLAVFNLVPGAPLDGGRVLRALVWWVTRRRRTGLRIAARAGQAIALGIVALGVWAVTTGGTATTVGNLTTLLIALFLGFFLWTGARSELRQSDLDDALDHHRVAGVVEIPEPVERDRPLSHVTPSTDAAALPVTVDGEVVGVLDREEIDALHPADRSVRTAGELMRPLVDAPAVDLDEPVRALITAFDGAHGVVRVTRGGRTVAVVTRREAVRLVEALRAGSVPRRVDAAASGPGGRPA